MYDFLGIWLHETGILGASPDGFVQGTFKDSLNVYHQQAQCRISPDIVEIKCPFSAKDMTVAAACTTIKDFYIGKSEIHGHVYWWTLVGLTCNIFWIYIMSVCMKFTLQSLI